MSTTTTKTAVERKQGETTNGMVANTTTQNACTDLFFQIGAMRRWNDSQIVSAFRPAFKENPLTALKVLFYSRDIILGQGERNTFRVIMKDLVETDKESVRKNLKFFSEFGRWDDLITLFGTELEEDALNLIEQGLKDENGLCGKWMPREKSKTYPGAWKKNRKENGSKPKRI